MSDNGVFFNTCAGLRGGERDGGLSERRHGVAVVVIGEWDGVVASDGNGGVKEASSEVVLLLAVVFAHDGDELLLCEERPRRFDEQSGVGKSGEDGAELRQGRHAVVVVIVPPL